MNRDRAAPDRRRRAHLAIGPPTLGTRGTSTAHRVSSLAPRHRIAEFPLADARRAAPQSGACRFSTSPASTGCARSRISALGHEVPATGLVIIGVHTPSSASRRTSKPSAGPRRRWASSTRSRWTTTRRLARLRQPVLACALRVRCAGPPAASPVRRGRIRARRADRPAVAGRGGSARRRPPAGDGRGPRHRRARRFPRPLAGNVRRL